MPFVPHVTAIDSDRHSCLGASTATVGQVIEHGSGADVQSWVTYGGDVRGRPSASRVEDLTISGEDTGDMLYFNGVNWVRLGSSTAGLILQTNSNSAAPSWTSNRDLLLTDNLATAYRLRESTNNYLLIDTSNSGASITLGNTTTDPSFIWLSDGPWIFGGTAGTTGQVLTTTVTGSPVWTTVGTSGIGVTLDQAYDFGGPGAGRQINVTDGAVALVVGSTAPGTGLAITAATTATTALSIGANFTTAISSAGTYNQTAGNIVFSSSAGTVQLGTETAEARVHISNGSAGSVTVSTPTVGPTLILERNANTWLQFQTPAANQAGLMFGSPSDPMRGRFVFDHATDRFTLVRTGNELIRGDSNGIALSNATDNLPVILNGTGDLRISSQMRITERTGDPTNVTDAGFLYAKDAVGVTQLYYETSAGTVYQLTPTLGGATGVSLDSAYDYPTAGAGRTITADTGAVAITSGGVNATGLAMTIGAATGTTTGISIGAGYTSGLTTASHVQVNSTFTLGSPATTVDSTPIDSYFGHVFEHKEYGSWFFHAAPERDTAFWVWDGDEVDYDNALNFVCTSGPTQNSSIFLGATDIVVGGFPTNSVFIYGQIASSAITFRGTENHGIFTAQNPTAAGAGRTLQIIGGQGADALAGSAAGAGGAVSLVSGPGGIGTGARAPGNGADTLVQGGAAGTRVGFGNANGGAVYLRGGALAGSGTNGTVVIGDSVTSAISMGATGILTTNNGNLTILGNLVSGDSTYNSTDYGTSADTWSFFGHELTGHIIFADSTIYNSGRKNIAAQRRQTVGSAGNTMTLHGQPAGNGDASNDGGLGGAGTVSGGAGGDGFSGRSPGQGGDGAIRGGPAGLLNGSATGSGANGGDAVMFGGLPTPTSSNGLYGRCRIGYQFTRATEIGNTTDNSPVTFLGSGDVRVTSQIRLAERVGDPTNVSDNGFLYVKDTAGVSQLFYETSAGTVYQLTPVSVGGSASTLQDAYDGGENIVIAASTPIGVSIPNTTVGIALTVAGGVPTAGITIASGMTNGLTNASQTTLSGAVVISGASTVSNTWNQTSGLFNFDGGDIDLDPTGWFRLDMDGGQDVTITLADNFATAFVLQNGNGDDMIAIDTSNGAEVIAIGNDASDPNITYLGDGLWLLQGTSGSAGDVITSQAGGGPPIWAPQTGGAGGGTQTMDDTYNFGHAITVDAGAIALSVANGQSAALTLTTAGTVTAGITIGTGFTDGITNASRTTLTAGLVQSGGAVALTATGASSFTATAALTITGGAASTWSTSAGALTLTSAAAATWSTAAGALTLTSAAAATWSTAAGALTLDSAAALNLGTTAATSIAIGHSGITTTITGSLSKTTGQVTLGGNVDATAGVDITGGALTIANQAITQTTGGQVTFAGNLDANAGVDVTGALTLTAGAATLTANAASSLTTAAGALTLTSFASATWGTSNSGTTLNLAAAGTTALTLSATTITFPLAISVSGGVGTNGFVLTSTAGGQNIWSDPSSVGATATLQSAYNATSGNTIAVASSRAIALTVTASNTLMTMAAASGTATAGLNIASSFTDGIINASRLTQSGAMAVSGATTFTSSIAHSVSTYAFTGTTFAVSPSSTFTLTAGGTTTLNILNSSASSFLIQNATGGADYFNIDTSGNALTFGNASGNPTYTFSGTGDSTFNGNVTISQSNTNVTSLFTIAQASTGDAAALFRQSLSGILFQVGIDHSDTDRFKISRSAALGTNDIVSIGSAESVLTGRWGIGGTAAATAQLNVIVPDGSSTSAIIRIDSLDSTGVADPILQWTTASKTWCAGIDANGNLVGNQAGGTNDIGEFAQNAFVIAENGGLPASTVRRFTIEPNAGPFRLRTHATGSTGQELRMETFRRATSADPATPVEIWGVAIPEDTTIIAYMALAGQSNAHGASFAMMQVASARNSNGTTSTIQFNTLNTGQSGGAWTNSGFFTDITGDRLTIRVDPPDTNTTEWSGHVWYHFVQNWDGT